MRGALLLGEGVERLVAGPQRVGRRRDRHVEVLHLLAVGVEGHFGRPGPFGSPLFAKAAQ